MELFIEEKNNIDPFNGPLPFNLHQDQRKRIPNPIPQQANITVKKYQPQTQPKQPTQYIQSNRNQPNRNQTNLIQPNIQKTQQNPITNIKPRDFSYDHILNSLNMKVTDGKLEYVRPPQNNNNKQTNHNLEESKNKVINHYFQNNPSNQYNNPSFIQTPVFRSKREAYLYYLQQQYEREQIKEVKSKKILYPANKHISIANPSYKPRLYFQ